MSCSLHQMSAILIVNYIMEFAGDSPKRDTLQTAETRSKYLSKEGEGGNYASALKASRGG